MGRALDLDKQVDKDSSVVGTLDKDKQDYVLKYNHTPPIYKYWKYYFHDMSSYLLPLVDDAAERYAPRSWC